jgi:hypothetical protein
MGLGENLFPKNPSAPFKIRTAAITTAPIKS